MEIKKEVKTIMVEYQCPKCKVGRLESDGRCYPTAPPKYPHKCNNCDYAETFLGKAYPYIDYE